MSVSVFSIEPLNCVCLQNGVVQKQVNKTV